MKTLLQIYNWLQDQRTLHFTLILYDMTSLWVEKEKEEGN